MLGNLITQEDVNAINTLQKVKKDIMRYIDMELFIDKVRDIIRNSDNFDFRSERVARFIDPEKPVFVLKSPLLEVSGKNANNINYLDYLTDEITDVVANEIITKISDVITTCIKDTDGMDSLFKDVPDDIKVFYLTNIYTIRISPSSNNINIQYFI